MSQTFSMVGVDIRIDGSTAEIRVEGVRTPDMVDSAGKVLFCLLKKSKVTTILLDMRMAHYIAKSVDLDGKIRKIVRNFKNYRLAFVINAKQKPRIIMTIQLHKEHKGQSQYFNSLKLARQWCSEDHLESSS